MSALGLRKVNGKASGIDPCDNGCARKGRFYLSIAGHPVPAESRLARHPQTLICDPCAKEIEAMWSEFNGKRHEDETRAAVEALAGTPSERAEGVWALRDLGYSAEATALAVADTARGKSVEQILDGLEGPGLEEAA